jgi:hypothetical protein
MSAVLSLKLPQSCIPDLLSTPIEASPPSPRLPSPVPEAVPAELSEHPSAAAVEPPEPVVEPPVEAAEPPVPAESADDDADVMIIEIDPEQLRRTKTLRQLRDMCVARGLPDHGKKSEVVDRLVEAR